MTSDNLTAAEYAKSCRESERVHKGSERRVGLDWSVNGRSADAPARPDQRAAN